MSNGLIAVFAFACASTLKLIKFDLLLFGYVFSPVFLFQTLRYFLLRFIFGLAQVVPWDYRAFLDWACDRFILQKVGDSYIFIHRMIREHFAEMDIDAFMQWVETREVQVEQRS